MMMLKLQKIFLVLLLFNLSSVISAAQNELLKTVQLFYYNPFDHNEESINGNCTLNSFSNALPTKILIHGYIASRYHSSIAPIKNAYLAVGDVNVIIADWSQAAYQSYKTSRLLTTQVALRISEILKGFFARHNVDYNLVHVIGHSLGAHIAGNVGRFLDGRIGRVTGLDPAMPLYAKWSADAISPSDAVFTDIIHTNGKVLGEIWPRGHIDFYPNYGVQSQPGCETKDILTFYSCSHFRSAELFAESIFNKNSFLSVECSLDKILEKEHCPSTFSRIIVMGEYVPKEVRGVFFLQTNNISPYGKGNYSELYS